MKHISFRPILGIALLTALSTTAHAQFGGFLKKLTDKVDSKEKELTEKVEPKSEKKASSSREEAPAPPVATLGKAVITKVPVKTFEEAKANAVTEVSDGDPVYLNLQLPEPVVNYVATSMKSEYAQDSGNDKILRLEVGPRGKLKENYKNSEYMPRPEDEKSSFVSINLAPGVVTRHDMACWLDTVGKGMAGVWHNEIRVLAYGKTDDDKFDMKLLAVAPLTANVPNGIEKYERQADKYAERHKKGDVSINAVPSKGKLWDQAIKAKVLAEAKNQLREKVEGFYFRDNEWGIRSNELNIVDRNVTGAAVLYKREGKNYVRYVFITKWKRINTVDVAFQAEDEVSAAEYAKGMAYAK